MPLGDKFLKQQAERTRRDKENDTYQDMENVNRENAYQKLADRISLLEVIVYEYLENRISKLEGGQLAAEM